MMIQSRRTFLSTAAASAALAAMPLTTHARPSEQDGRARKMLLSVVSCGAPQGATGVTGEWVKGKALTVRVNIISQRADQPSLDLRNDTGKDLSILPLRVIAWYEKSGKQEKPEQPGQLFLAAGQTLTGLTLNLSPPVVDRLQKIQIFHASKGEKNKKCLRSLGRPTNVERVLSAGVSSDVSTSSF